MSSWYISHSDYGDIALLKIGDNKRTSDKHRLRLALLVYDGALTVALTPDPSAGVVE